MKSIIISLLDTRTPILVKLGKLLKKRGFKVYYFSNENFDKEFHIDNMLLLDENIDIEVEPNLKSKFEKIYKSDRSLHYYFNKDKALMLMQTWHNKAEAFIKKHKIEFCFIEGTPAHELVFEMACKKNNVKIINIIHAPGSRGWSLISKSSVEYPLYKNKKANKEYIDQIKNKPISNKIYLDVNHTLIGKIKRLIFMPKNFNQFPKNIKIIKGICFPINLFLRFILSINKKQFNHVFFVHLEPERTVYNCGAIFTRQKDALKYITKNLGFKITIKEHPNHIAKLPLSFLLHILINPKINYVTKLTHTPKLAWTFSGSIAWERTLQGLPVVALGKTYLQKSNLVKGFPKIKTNIGKYDGDFFNYISKHVFKGELTGTHWSPNDLSDENIENLFTAVKNCMFGD